MMKMVVPEIIVRLRQAKGLSQAELARRMGIAKSSLNHLESGFAEDMMVSTLIKCAHELGVTPNFILGIEYSKIASGKCDRCGVELVAGHTHFIPECMVNLWRKEVDVDAIAGLFGVSRGSASRIITDEIERRRRLKPAALKAPPQVPELG